MAEIPATSPCRNICTLDETGCICLGCGRTLEQIARWPLLSDVERRAIMADLYAASTREHPVH